jgi:RNA methyltransferase, TrmH family
MAKYKRYKKEWGYSYTLGFFLTIELLINKPEQVLEVIISSETNDQDGLHKVNELCLKHHIPVTISDKQINILSPKGNCYAVGVFKLYEETIEKGDHHLVLVNPSDSGNLGTMIRTALGFNITNLAIIRPGVDIFDPKTIRASMGSLFSIQFTYYDSFEDYEKTHQKHHLYPFMLQAKQKLQEVEPQNPFSLVFGNEATGLDATFLSKGTSLIIPHSNRIDSLNLSIAASLAMYEFTKRQF